MRAGLLARAVALAVFAAGATLTPQAARAAFVEHIFEAGTTNLLGTISLPTISGTSAAGVALSLNMFTEADITSINWTLNPADFSVVALSLSAFQGDAVCPGATPCSNASLSLDLSSVAQSTVQCTALAGCIVGDLFLDVEYRVAAAPEPDGITLLTVGLLGLAFLSWLRMGAWGPRPQRGPGAALLGYSPKG